MSKRSSSRTVRSQRALKQLDPMALPALIGLAGGLFTAYIIAEIVLANSAHPLHWVAAIAGAVAGYLFGLLYLTMKS